MTPFPPHTTPEEIDRLHVAQQDFAPVVGQYSIAQRRIFLKALLRNILRYQKEIEEALYQDLRKPPMETAYSEVLLAVSNLRFTRKHLREWARPKTVANNLVFVGARAQILSEPRGNCLIITPWNYPFLLPILALTACIAAGNTAMIKPSEFCPHTNRILQTILSEVFAPEQVCFVHGSVPETTLLLRKKFDHIHFTGSSTVGKIIMTAAAKNLSSVTLELGGKNPVIVDWNTNLHEAATKLV